MLRGEKQVEMATLRLELRAIDAEIAAVRRESRRYRQMRFGLDIKDIQLTALQDQRDACAARLADLRRQLHINHPRRSNPLAWLLLPVALWLRAQEALAARSAMADNSAPAMPAPMLPEDEVPTTRRRSVLVAAGR